MRSTIIFFAFLLREKLDLRLFFVNLLVVNVLTTFERKACEYCRDHGPREVCCLRAVEPDPWRSQEGALRAGFVDAGVQAFNPKNKSKRFLGLQSLRIFELQTVQCTNSERIH